MLSEKSRGYDYNHATSSAQFIALLIVLGMLAGAGASLGLILLLFLT